MAISAEKLSPVLDRDSHDKSPLSRDYASGSSRITKKKFKQSPGENKKKAWVKLKNGLFGWRVVKKKQQVAQRGGGEGANNEQGTIYFWGRK